MRLIDADALIEAMERRYEEIKFASTNNLGEGFYQVDTLIKQQPTVEAIPKSKLDEIVERLEELKNDFENKNFDKKHCQKMIYLKTCLGRNCFECVLNGAIEIVKGVINERD